jgi:hypothetical protein
VARTCDTVSLGFQIEPSFTGHQTLPAVLNFQGKPSFGVAELDVFGTQSGGTSGALSITGDGWSLQGEFTAPDCPELDDFGGK